MINAMTKLDEVIGYLNNNSEKSKDKLLIDLEKKFKLSSNSARQYYYKWKKEFIGSNECIPKEEKVVKVNKPLPRKNGKFNYDKIIAEAKEEVKNNAIATVNKATEPTKKSVLKIVSAKIKGKYGDYELKEDGSVRAGEETFKSAEEVEEYRSREIANFMARLGEILDVMEMGVNR